MAETAADGARSRLLTLVFTDLVESTRLKAQRGDHSAASLIRRHQDLVQRLARDGAGREVDSAGDGFFLTFETPSAAAAFALRLQRVHLEELDLPPVRVGIHIGEVTERPSPEGSSKPTLVEGLAVDLAARIQSVASPGQILLSSTAFDSARQRLSPEDVAGALAWRFHGPYLFKGLADPVEIGEVGFEEESPLRAPPDSEKARRAPESAGTSARGPQRRQEQLALALRDLERALAKDVSALPRRAAGVRAVGRDAELALLGGWLGEAEAGRGSLVCVSGEPGLGKTTLMNAFLKASAASGRPCIVLDGRCSERLAGAEGLLSVLEALDQLLERVGDPVAEVLKLSAPAWYLQVAREERLRSVDDWVRDEARLRSAERMKRELAHFLRQLGRVAPVIVVIEDVHWGDASTVDLLAHLASHAAETPLLLLVTYRPAESTLSDNQFDQLRLDLTARGMCRQVDLEFLTRDAIRQYLCMELATDTVSDELVDVSDELVDVSDDLVDLIQARTEGNALFVVNLVRHLQSGGHLSPVDGCWALRGSLDEVTRTLPVSLQSMIQRKIEQLGPDDQKLLRAASVQGADFDSTTVAGLLDEDAADVEDRLQVLADTFAFVSELGEQELPNGDLTTRYRFVHILYQNALYDSLSAARRRRWSREAADLLMSAYRDADEPVAGRVAFLLEEAREFARASDAFLKAAQSARRLSANREALGLLQRAIACAERLSGKERSARVLQAATLRGRIHTGLRMLAEAARDFEQAESMARELGDARAQVNALCGKGLAYVFSYRLSEARQESQRALEQAREVDSPLEVAAAEAVVACERMVVGDLQPAWELFGRSLPVLERHGPLSEVIHGAGMYGLLQSWKLDHREAARSIRWMQDQAEAADALFPAIQGRFFQGMHHGNQGRLGEGLRWIHEGRRLCELHGETGYWAGRLTNTLGWLHSEMSDLETALELDRESVALCRAVGEPHSEANARINVARDLLDLGDPGAALEHLDAAEAFLHQDVWLAWRFNLRLLNEFARYWIARGDLEKARLYAEEGVKAAADVDGLKHLSVSHQRLGEIALKEQRVRESRQHFDRALGVLANGACPTVEWRVLRSAAALASEVGDDDRRVECLGRSDAVRQALAATIEDEHLRSRFLETRLPDGT